MAVILVHLSPSRIVTIGAFATASVLHRSLRVPRFARLAAVARVRDRVLAPCARIVLRGAPNGRLALFEIWSALSRSPPCCSVYRLPGRVVLFESRSQCSSFAVGHRPGQFSPADSSAALVDVGIPHRAGEVLTAGRVAAPSACVMICFCHGLTLPCASGLRKHYFRISFRTKGPDGGTNRCTECPPPPLHLEALFPAGRLPCCRSWSSGWASVSLIDTRVPNAACPLAHFPPQR